MLDIDMPNLYPSLTKFFGYHTETQPVFQEMVENYIEAFHKTSKDVTAARAAAQ